MVTNVASFSGNGLKDWLLQRITAVILIAYILYLTLFFVGHYPLHFSQWEAFFEKTWTRVLSFLSLLSLVVHAWIGIWTCITDYIKCTVIKMVVHVTVIMALIGYLGWGILIFWG